jgi:hypothetical protein
MDHEAPSRLRRIDTRGLVSWVLQGPAGTNPNLIYVYDANNIYIL